MFSISSVDSYLNDHSLFFCQISTGKFTLLTSPLLNLISKTTGRGIFSRFSNEIITPNLGLFFTYLTLVIPWSKRQLLINQPLQNQFKSSPATFSIVLKKSSGVGCLNAHRATYVLKALSKRSLPKICSLNIINPEEGL